MNAFDKLSPEWIARYYDALHVPGTANTVHTAFNWFLECYGIYYNGFLWSDRVPVVETNAEVRIPLTEAGIFVWDKYGMLIVSEFGRQLLTDFVMLSDI